jgi:protein-disulfide isomerase
MVEVKRMNRSGLIAGAAAVVVVVAGAVAWSMGIFAGSTPIAAAQGEAGANRSLSAFESELLEPGVLPEMTLGDPDAPVTMVEYASMTCSHCAAFHETTWPVLKAEYIDTGKVHFIMREFPLDPLAAAAFMLARNAPGDRYFDVVDLLFSRQRDWAFAADPVAALRDLSKQFGYSPQTFEATLKDQELLDGVNAARTRGSERFNVQSTPTFFINGEEVRGAMGPDALRERLDALVPG